MKTPEELRAFIENIVNKHVPNKHVPNSLPDPPSVGNFKCDMVIARYKENLSWLDRYHKYGFRDIIVYNKGKNDGICKLNSITCKQHHLPNHGRCDHTYLYHIIHNYDNLADVTIFTKGSSNNYQERKKLLFTISKVFETKNSVFSAAKMDTPVHISAAGFTLDAHKSKYHENHNTDPKNNITKPADIRPFDKWYLHHFPDISIYNIVFTGVFAVSKEHIHHRPIEFYKELLKQLEGHSNPEVGHYIERSWIAIFYPPDKNDTKTIDNYMGCIYHDILHEIYMGGSRKRRKYRRRRYTR